MRRIADRICPQMLFRYVVSELLLALTSPILFCFVPGAECHCHRNYREKRHHNGFVTGCSLTLLAAIILSTVPASASKPSTSTTLAVTSGGSAVTTVTAGSVVVLTATVTTGITQLTTGQVNFCDAMQ